MDTATIRQKLHEYIEQVDDKRVEGLYLFVSDEINSQHITLTAEELRLLDEDRENYLREDSESYSWEEAKEIIRGKKDL